MGGHKTRLQPLNLLINSYFKNKSSKRICYWCWGKENWMLPTWSFSIFPVIHNFYLQINAAFFRTIFIHKGREQTQK